MASVKQGHVVTSDPDGKAFAAPTQAAWLGSLRLSRATNGPVSVSVTAAPAAAYRQGPPRSGGRSSRRVVPPCR